MIWLRGFLSSLTAFTLIGYHGWCCLGLILMCGVQSLAWSLLQPVVNAHEVCSARHLGFVLAFSDVFSGLLHLLIAMGLNLCENANVDDFENPTFLIKIAGFNCKVLPAATGLLKLATLPVNSVVLAAILFTVVCAHEGLIWCISITTLFRILYISSGILIKESFDVSPPLFVPKHSKGVAGIRNVILYLGP